MPCMCKPSGSDTPSASRLYFTQSPMQRGMVTTELAQISSKTRWIFWVCPVLHRKSLDHDQFLLKTNAHSKIGGSPYRRQKKSIDDFGALASFDLVLVTLAPFDFEGSASSPPATTLEMVVPDAPCAPNAPRETTRAVRLMCHPRRFILLSALAGGSQFGLFRVHGSRHKPTTGAVVR